jgi:hypothetical protein
MAASHMRIVVCSSFTRGPYWSEIMQGVYYAD